MRFTFVGRSMGDESDPNCQNTSSDSIKMAKNRMGNLGRRLVMVVSDDGDPSFVRTTGTDIHVLKSTPEYTILIGDRCGQLPS